MFHYISIGQNRKCISIYDFFEDSDRDADIEMYLCVASTDIITELFKLLLSTGFRNVASFDAFLCYLYSDLLYGVCWRSIACNLSHCQSIKNVNRSCYFVYYWLNMFLRNCALKCGTWQSLRNWEWRCFFIEESIKLLHLMMASKRKQVSLSSVLIRRSE